MNDIIVGKLNNHQTMTPTGKLRVLSKRAGASGVLQQEWLIAEFDENGKAVSVKHEWHNVPTVVEDKTDG